MTARCLHLSPSQRFRWYSLTAACLQETNSTVFAASTSASSLKLQQRAEAGQVTEDDVDKAIKLLTDEWLCDVATDYCGKCIIIAAGLTIIERSLLPDRPAFFVTAGRRGGGKTTTLTMLIIAIAGVWPAAAAWSTNEEERRKALLSYFLYGVSYIIWDNIARGTQISCPHIEKSCTAAYYSDRKLGVSEMVATAASIIHFLYRKQRRTKGGPGLPQPRNSS